jgi:NAD(P)-dependent dehydrogenase (short-subunit alcohol dehydrogenase family)
MTSPALDGMLAIVAGAGPGIGRACAEALLREGADVVVAARDQSRLETLSVELGAGAGGAGRARPRVVPMSFDLADLESCRALVDQTVDRLGRLDILVNVATAGGEYNPVDEGEWESWRQAFEVNVIGTLELSRLAARAMQQNEGIRAGGSIVQIGTIGTRAFPQGRARYAATKSAMVAASLTMAKELGPSGVRVNVVTPGFTTGAPLTAMIGSIATRTGESSEDVSARMASGASLHRHVDPADVAEAVVFLAGPGARNITGIELPVTAGR